ncbi:hypothetical protein [Streptomyces sp. NPDC092952]|uniref:hypothetical protein n=1 Tax=Streptomyces sp. NPDC092952 TaxID=3366018 RepID=UPI0037FD6489
MTPHSLAFYVDVVTTGTVLGAGPTDSPEQVTAILGPDSAENSVGEHSMWRDYGMAEFFWCRESPDHPWAGLHFTLQTHRLATLGGSTVNRAIREQYGRFDRHLRYDRLERLLGRRGVHLEDVPNPNAPSYSLHWQPGSGVSVLVFRAHGRTGRRRGDARLGDVHAIASSMTAERVAWYRARH